MKRTLGFLSVAALLATGGAAMAPGAGVGDSSQSVTGTQLHSPQEGTPATGSATTAPGYTYQRNGATDMSAQSTGQYPGAVGPTGSTQPDATNPVRSNPSGGGGQGDGQGSSGH
jgi:hypothetical protein